MELEEIRVFLELEYILAHCDATKHQYWWLNSAILFVLTNGRSRQDVRSNNRNKFVLTN